MPICSMYGIFTYIYPKNDPNVGKYSIHGAYGHGEFPWGFSMRPSPSPADCAQRVALNAATVARLLRRDRLRQKALDRRDAVLRL